MSHTIALPVQIHDRLWAGFAQQAARELTAKRIAEPDELLIHGEDIGSFLGWWWKEDEGTAVRFLLDYVEEIQRADPLRPYDSAEPLSFDTIVEVLPIALSSMLNGEEADAFIDRTRAEVG